MTMVQAYNISNDGLNTSTLTTSSFTPQAGEVLVVKVISADTGQTHGTPTATGLVFTKRAEVTAASHCRVTIFTATVGSTSAVTVGETFSGTSVQHMMTVERHSDVQIDSSPVVMQSVGSGAPNVTSGSLNAGSTFSWTCGDWFASAGTPAYRSSAVQTASKFISGQYGGYCANTPVISAGTVQVGMTSPAGQTYSLAGIELKSIGSDATVDVPSAAASAEIIEPALSAGVTVFPGPIRNLHTNPKLGVDSTNWTSPGGWTSGRRSVTDLPDGIAWEYALTGSDTNSGARVFTTLFNLTIGRLYRVSAWCRRYGQSASFRIDESSNVQNPASLSPTDIGTAPEWLTGTFVATASTMYLQNRQVGAATGPVELSMTGVMLTEGDAPHLMYCDGDTPGWRWLSTPDRSRSEKNTVTARMLAPSVSVDVSVDVPVSSGSGLSLIAYAMDWDENNLIPSNRVINGGSGVNLTSTQSNSTTPRGGPGGLARWDWTASGTQSGVWISTVAIESGKPYTVKAYGIGPPGATMRARLEWRGPDGALGVVNGPGVTVDSDWSVIKHTAVAPNEATGCRPTWYTLGAVAGEAYALTGIDLYLEDTEVGVVVPVATATAQALVPSVSVISEPSGWAKHSVFGDVEPPYVISTENDGTDITLGAFFTVPSEGWRCTGAKIWFTTPDPSATITFFAWAIGDDLLDTPIRSKQGQALAIAGQWVEVVWDEPITDLPADTDLLVGYRFDPPNTNIYLYAAPGTDPVPASDGSGLELKGTDRGRFSILGSEPAASNLWYGVDIVVEEPAAVVTSTVFTGSSDFLAPTVTGGSGSSVTSPLMTANALFFAPDISDGTVSVTLVVPLLTASLDFIEPSVIQEMAVTGGGPMLATALLRVPTVHGTEISQVTWYYKNESGELVSAEVLGLWNGEELVSAEFVEVT